jgi:hypothetical protein
LGAIINKVTMNNLNASFCGGMLPFLLEWNCLTFKCFCPILPHNLIHWLHKKDILCRILNEVCYIVGEIRNVLRKVWSGTLEIWVWKREILGSIENQEDFWNEVTLVLGTWRENKSSVARHSW